MRPNESESRVVFAEPVSEATPGERIPRLLLAYWPLGPLVRGVARLRLSVHSKLLGAFLLIGLATRFWAVVGMAQTVVIMLSVLNAPHEWFWSYILMLLVHMALFATAAGRYAGLDGLFRPGWQRSHSWAMRSLARAS